MKPRRSKVAPAPLYKEAEPLVDGTAAAVPTRLARKVENESGSSGSPRTFMWPSYTSPTSTTNNSSKGRAVIDANGLPVEERVVVADHVTNSGTVVTLTRIDYSDVMRAYRVCRQTPNSTMLSTNPILRLFTVNDLLLVALTLALFLHAFTRGAVSSLPALFAPLFAAKIDAPTWENAAADNGVLSNKILLLLMLACPLLLACRFLLALRRVFVEEVLAIRGIGIQFTTYGVFNQVKTKEFVDLRLVRSIVIHDAFWRYQPIFTLTSSIENRPSRVVYFENVLPRLDVLRPVLCGIRHILFEELEDGLSLSEMETAQRLENMEDGDSGNVSRDTDSTFEDSFSGMNPSEDYDLAEL